MTDAPMNFTGFEFGTHSGKTSVGSYMVHDGRDGSETSYGLRIQPSTRETPPQRYEPDEDHPCGAVAIEYPDGTPRFRCVLDVGHEGWHASEPAQPPYEKYPQIQWAGNND